MNSESGLYDLPYRNFDAALGRFFQVDPMAHVDHTTSPFAYGGNNPVMMNDPSGLMVPGAGLSDSQLRSLYRTYGSGYGSFDDWAQDNVVGYNGGGGGGAGAGGGMANEVPALVMEEAMVRLLPMMMMRAVATVAPR